MRAFLDVLKFELRLQCSSPLFLGVLLLFFLIHLLTIGEAGINLSDNDLILLNGPSQIFQAEVVLGTFGMLPAIIFIVNAMVRDYDRATVELFFTTPVGKLPWLLGRFAGGTLCALFAGVAGVLGTMAGTSMPWIDPSRVALFDVVPYAVSFATIVVPNMLIFCAISFSVAALTRSQAWTFAVALVLVVFEIVLNLAQQGGPSWVALLDPLGALSLVETTRYWTVAELNAQLPVTGRMVANRLIWLTIAAATLAFALGRVRLELAEKSGTRLFRWRRHEAPATVAPASSAIDYAGSFTPRDTFAQLASQLAIDLRGVVLTPLFALIVLFTVVANISEFSALTDRLIGLPLHPMTSLMLGFIRYGLLQFVLLILIYDSATLVFREREHRLAEIVGASPHPDWIMAVSKTLTLCAEVTLVLIVSMGTSIVLQLSAGQRELDLGVYLQNLFIYNGFYFYMLCVLSVFVQVISPGKWSGMVLLLLVLIGLFSMEELGLEHVLYGFRIPYVVHSEMNGFGHFRLPTVSLIVYWGLFCVLLLVAGRLLYHRGTVMGLRERLRDARTRMTPGLLVGSSLAAALFAAAGGWIYWNTNVLNHYETAASRRQDRATYKRQYGSWKNRPTPAFSSVDMEVDLYPDERRLESRGTATLINRKSTPIAELLVSSDPRLRIDTVSLDGATLTHEDTALGVRVYRTAGAAGSRPQHADAVDGVAGESRLRQRLARQRNRCQRDLCDADNDRAAARVRRGTRADRSRRAPTGRPASGRTPRGAGRSGLAEHVGVRRGWPHELPRRVQHVGGSDCGGSWRFGAAVGTGRPALLRVRHGATGLAGCRFRVRALHDRPRQVERRLARGLSRREAPLERPHHAGDGQPVVRVLQS